MEIDLQNKSFCIFGPPDSGKSTLANSILNKFGNTALVYDILCEYPAYPFDSYEPKDRNSVSELESVVRDVMRSGKYRLFVLDEANRHCPTKPTPLPRAIEDLNDWRAHYDLATGYICRLPVQLNQNLTEMADYLLIFRMAGKNCISYLNDLSIGLGDASLKLADYHFLLVYPDRRYEVINPVPAHFATNKKSPPAIKTEA